MQPYFFPYIGYFSLIKQTDYWIVLDEVQFIRHGWIERNRILKPDEGWQYISVPRIKHPRETKIKDIKIKEDGDWRNKILRQIEHYKKAPFYAATVALVENALNIETESIVELNISTLKTICEYLSISFNCDVFSRMNIEIEPVTNAGEWALNIGKTLNAKEYINPPGGAAIFDKKQFADAQIKLTILKNNLPPYNQRRNTFEPGLSIVDVLMFNDAETINSMIDDAQLINLI